ncbi:unnamed protein product [Amoebophrya sp. A25]|nr:unnamed protein product [Amoebophrya sp. A25]|eukprot:GSA25T00018979001.1
MSEKIQQPALVTPTLEDVLDGIAATHHLSAKRKRQLTAILRKRFDAEVTQFSHGRSRSGSCGESRQNGSGNGNAGFIFASNASLESTSSISQELESLTSGTVARALGEELPTFPATLRGDESKSIEVKKLVQALWREYHFANVYEQNGADDGYYGEDNEDDPRDVVPGGKLLFPSRHLNPFAEHQGSNYEQSNQLFLVLDWEATCWDKKSTPHQPHARQEIIEFPVVLLSGSGSELGEFHQFVYPEESGGKLSAFCTQLTGIRESQVRNAKTLEFVLKDFLAWLDRAAEIHLGAFRSKGKVEASPEREERQGIVDHDKQLQDDDSDDEVDSPSPSKRALLSRDTQSLQECKESSIEEATSAAPASTKVCSRNFLLGGENHVNFLLGGENYVTLVCCGRWDGRQLAEEVERKRLEVPKWLVDPNNWRDARRHGAIFYRGNHKKPLQNLTAVVEESGERMTGRLHSGIADARNLAKAVRNMLRGGYQFREYG